MAHLHDFEENVDEIPLKLGLCITYCSTMQSTTAGGGFLPRAHHVVPGTNSAPVVAIQFPVKCICFVYENDNCAHSKTFLLLLVEISGY